MKKLLLVLVLVSIASMAFAGYGPQSVTYTASGPVTIYEGNFQADKLYVDSIVNTATVITIKDGTVVKRVVVPGVEREIPLYDLIFRTSIIIDWGTNTGNATVGGNKLLF